MKNRLLIIMCIVPCILCSTKNFCSTLTFFMKPYPEIQPEEAALSIQKKLQKPGKIAHYLMPGAEYESVVGGIFSTYVGYIAASDYDGQTTFPQNLITIDNPKGYILVTRHVNPITTLGLTVFRLDRDPKQSAVLYAFELKKDEDLNEYFWEMHQTPLKDSLKISMKALIIFADPKKIYIPEGITPTKAVANMVLPDIYVKKGTTKAHDALYVLTIKHFFSPVHKEYQREPLRNIIQM